MMTLIEAQSAIRKACFEPSAFAIEIKEFLAIDRSEMTPQVERSVLFALIKAHMKSHDVQGI